MKSHDFQHFIRSSRKIRSWWKSWFSIFYQIIGKNEVLMKIMIFDMLSYHRGKIRFWWTIRIFDILSDHREEWDFNEKSWFSTFYQIIAGNKILMKNHDFRYFIKSSGRVRFWWKIMIFGIVSYHRGT